MDTADKSNAGWLYVFIRDRRVQILRVFILLCGFAALALSRSGEMSWQLDSPGIPGPRSDFCSHRGSIRRPGNLHVDKLWLLGG